MSGGGAFDAYLGARRREIDAALDEALPAPPACPPRIAEAMRYSVFAGGKRLRPILTLAAAEAAGPRRPDSPAPDAAARALALNGACAIELVHTYSLVHDDLPAMDDDDLRRGRPTSHVAFGEGLAILAGDALLTQAFTLLARRPAQAPPGFEGGSSAPSPASRRRRARPAWWAARSSISPPRGRGRGPPRGLRPPARRRPCATCTSARPAP